VIDYSQARLLDPVWWRRFYILANSVGTEDDKEVLQNIYRFHLALVSNSGLTEDSFKSAQTNARDTFFDLIGSLRPWEGTNAAERKGKEIEDLRQAYIDAFGDPNDPVFAKQLEEGVARLLAAQHEKENREDDMDRVRRLQEEQAKKVEVLKEKFARKRRRFMQGRSL
jgi:hypothetical protein